MAAGSSVFMSNAEQHSIDGNESNLSAVDEVQMSPTVAQATHVASPNTTMGSTSGVDAVDGFFHSPASGPNDAQKTRATIEQLKSKIFRVNEQIHIEQKSQDEYVSEYLRLTKSADRTQLNRIKGVFERKNQKSMANITQLRRKRDSYQVRIKDLQTNGCSSKEGRSSGRSALRDVGANLRGISGGVVGNIKQATQNAAEALVSKPKDIAHRLKNRFGSSDNLENLKDIEGEEGRYASGDEVSSNSEYDTNSLHNIGVPKPQGGTAGGGGGATVPGVTVTAPGQQQTTAMSNVAQDFYAEQHRVNNQLNTIITQLIGLKNSVDELRQQQSRSNEKFINLQKNVTDDFGDIMNNLRTERFRGERLESQVSNLIGFQDSGLNSLKEEINSIQAKFDYHLQERTREMQEAVGNCQARLQEMERQQRRLRNNSTDNAFDDASGRIIGKLFNLLMGLLAVVLVLSTTVVSFTKQLTQSKARFIVTCVVAVLALVVGRYWQPMHSYLYPSTDGAT